MTTLWHVYRKHSTLFSIFFVFVFAALVPLEEFREINYSKQYGLTNDPEVLEVLDAVSKTKGVLILFAFMLYIYTYLS